MTEHTLDVRDLVVNYGGPRSKHAPAVDKVSFTVAKGETLGIVGESGSGKSTIGKAILGLFPATAGSVTFQGRDITRDSLAKRRTTAADLRVVFQDPYSSLNPSMTIGETLIEPLRLRGVSAADAMQKARLAIDSVGLPADAVDRYPRQFSGGQRQRIAIARALIADPELIVLDEPVSALDLSTQAQVLNLLADLRAKREMSYLFIAHDLGVVRFLAQRVVVLYRGQIMEMGPADAVVEHPRHPYSQALVAASPVPRPAEQTARRLAREAQGVGAAGAVPASSTGCPFSTRCPIATEICRVERPALRRIGESDVACHHAS